MKVAFKLLSVFSCMTFMVQSCSSGPGEPKVHTVEIKNMQFVPANLVVKKGDTVLWINKDIMAHDVTEQTTKSWSSSAIPSGGTWKMAVNADADYYCSIHVVMKGKVKVE
jgi:plastocyanin